VLVVSLGVAFVLARRARRSGQIMPPLWSRPRQSSETLERSA